MSLTDPAHLHGRTCYWDHLRCGWVCVPARPGPDPEPAPASAPPAEAVPAAR